MCQQENSRKVEDPSHCLATGNHYLCLPRQDAVTDFLLSLENPGPCCLSCIQQRVWHVTSEVIIRPRFPTFINHFINPIFSLWTRNGCSFHKQVLPNTVPPSESHWLISFINTLLMLKIKEPSQIRWAHLFPLSPIVPQGFVQGGSGS